MERYRRLILGVEILEYGRALSQGSQAAIRQATWLAERTGASITLLYSHFGRESRPLFEAQAIEDLARKLKYEGRTVEGVVADGRPSDEIIARVEAGEADLVFVGKRNRMAGAASPLGNVARKLTRACPVPVWAVDPYHSRGIKAVLGAHDLRPVGETAASLAARLARLAECPLHLVHAFRDEADSLTAVDRMRASLGSICPDPPAFVDYHAARGASSKVILEAVDRHSIDVLVVGSVARGGIAGLFIGNTAEKVLEVADCSLITVKPEGWTVPPVADRRHTTMLPAVPRGAPGGGGGTPGDGP